MMTIEYTPPFDITERFTELLDESGIEYSLEGAQVLVHPRTEAERIRAEQHWEETLIDACRDGSAEGGE
jgi:hypothetical protein